MGVRESFTSLFCCAFVVFFVTACGSGSSSGSSEGVSQPAPPPPPPAPAPTAPELSNLAPTSLSFALQSGENASGTVTFTNSGDAALTYDLTTAAAWITLPANAAGTLQVGASASLTVGVSCSGVDLSGSVVLATNDADEVSSTIPVAATCSPLPTGFEIARVLLNQGARAFDSNTSSNLSIKVLAGREMIVRAFVTGSGTPPEARVVVSRPGQSDLTFSMRVPVSVGANPASQTILNASHHVVVPGAAVTDDAQIKVEVAPFSNPVTYPATGNIDLAAEDPGTFELTLVPVTFEGQTPTISISAYSRGILQLMPIGALDIEVRSAYTFTGTFDLDALLMEISDLRDLDGSTRLYHAVIIPPAGSSSPTAGVGFVGYPVSVSIDLGGIDYVVAHELGHNLNLLHAPGCDAPNPDPDYPYANGLVSSWGFDTTADSLVAPSATKTDIMSYCPDQWVSDYSFNRAIEYRSQSLIGFAPLAQGGLSISGRLLQDQVTGVRMMPTDKVAMRVTAADADQPYRFIAWDSNGIEVVNQSFNVTRIEDLQATDAFMLNVPRPVSGIDHYEVRRLGATLHTASNAAVMPNEISLSWVNGAAHVQWTPRSGEALVLRNVDGQVVTVDRSGSFRIQNASQLNVEFTAHGEVGGRMSAQAGTDRRLQFTR